MDETKQQTIAEEAGLPENWSPIDVAPIIPSAMPVPNSAGSTAPLVGSLPPGYQQNTDFSGVSKAGGRVPNLSLMPLGLQGNPATNAAITSTATKVAQGITPTASNLVSLNIPDIFTPTFQTEDSTGLLAFSLVPQFPNTVFAGPSGTIIDDLDSLTIAADITTDVSISGTPTQDGDFAIVFTAQDFNSGVLFTPDVSWSLNSSTTDQTIYSKVLSGASGATASGVTDPAFPAWCSILGLFATTGVAPAVINVHTIQSGAFSSVSASVGFTPTAGNALLIVIMSSDTAAVSGPATVNSFFDNHGDPWTFLGEVANNSGDGVQAVLYGVGDITGGSTTVDIVLNKTIAAANVVCLEVSHLAPLTEIVPRFRPLVSGDIPPIKLGSVNVNGGVTGILSPASLPADIAYTDVANVFTTTQTFEPASSVPSALFLGQFSTTTQMSQFSNLYVRYDLYQGGLTTPWTNYTLVCAGASTFPALGIALAAGTTANALDAYAPGSATVKNFSLGANGTVKNYAGIATVSQGVPAEYATVDLAAQAANIGATTLYAVPASGLYRISAYVVETTAATISSTLPNVQIVYTDPDAAVSITIDATPILGVAGIGQTGALTANTVGTAASGVIVINAQIGTNIQYQTVNYASVAAGMQYALHIKLEAL